MVGGAVISVLVFAVGAILDFAVTVSTNQHGFNIHTVGVILMIVGAVGFVASLVSGFFIEGGPRRHRTIVDDGQGHVARREDTYT
jgi:predicted MFS family arabinose efflux permease